MELFWVTDLKQISRLDPRCVQEKVNYLQTMVKDIWLRLWPQNKSFDHFHKKLGIEQSRPQTRAKEVANDAIYTYMHLCTIEKGDLADLVQGT